MIDNSSQALADVPSRVREVLGDFVDAARGAFGSDLRAVVLYGSAAEDRLRATSDVNVILVLGAFDRTRAEALREPLRVAQAAVRLAAMFLLESEIPAAAEAFSVKFADILRRRRVLFGDDPFTRLAISRPAEITRLKQVLLNLILRLRAAYVLRSLREEQVAVLVAEAAGPLRACAATLVELEGQPAGSAREALQRVAAALPGSGAEESLARLSEAREQRVLPAGVAGPTLFHLIELAEAMRDRAGRLG
jgi:predicted nucleotidyltransferase